MKKMLRLSPLTGVTLFSLLGISLSFGNVNLFMLLSTSNFLVDESDLTTSCRVQSNFNPMKNDSGRKC